MGKLLAEAQGEAITGQLKTSTLNLGYSGDDHCHIHRNNQDDHSFRRSFLIIILGVNINDVGTKLKPAKPRFQSCKLGNVFWCKICWNLICSKHH